jgi:hypothetical protein
LFAKLVFCSYRIPPEDRERLERLVRDRNTPQKIVWRSQIVLLAGEGMGAVELAPRRLSHLGCRSDLTFVARQARVYSRDCTVLVTVRKTSGAAVGRSCYLIG